MRVKRIRFKNILSYGNRFQEFEFKNGVDLILGSNGQGKSVLLDAITFGFYGKPYRKIRVNELVNDINQKELLVEIEFESNGLYKIRRGLKPSVFEIYRYENEWKLIPQDSHSKEYQKTLEDIIKIDENLFRQIIVLGINLSNMKNFSDLTPKEKEELFQNLTNTFIFYEIQKKAKEKLSYFDSKRVNLEYKKNTLESSIQSLEREYEEIRRKNEEFIQNKKEKLKELDEKEEKVKSIINKIQEKISIPLTIQYDKELQELQSKFLKIQSAISGLERYIEQYNQSEEIECPNCGTSFKKIELKDEPQKLQKLYLARNKLQEKLQEIQKLHSEEQEKLKKIEILKNKLIVLEQELQSIKNEKELINSYELIEIDTTKLNLMKKELRKILIELDEVNKEISYYTVIIDFIKKGKLKEKILKQQIPILNKYINEYLQLFGMDYSYIIEPNLKDKVIKRGKEYNFNTLSNGQKQRVLVALLFAFLKLMEMNGYKMNILVLDEFLDSSLDYEGIMMAVQIFNQLKREKDIIIISHNQSVLDEIEADRIFKVKRETFSLIQEVKNE